MIKSLSPYYLTTPFVSPRTSLTCTSYTLNIYVWNGSNSSTPATPSYVITKYNPTGSTSSDKINVARILNSFIDFAARKNTATSLLNGDNQKWVRFSTNYATTNPDDATIPQNVSTELLVHGYGYGIEGENTSTPATKVLLSGNEFNVNRNGFLSLGIELDQTTVAFGAVADTIPFYYQNTNFYVLANDALGYQPTTIITLSYTFPSDYGTLSIVDDKVLFTVGTVFNGSAQTFDYTIRDSTGQESTATATITATVLPATITAVDDAYEVNDVDTEILAVLSNDSLGTEPTTITNVVQTGITSGTITITGSGTTLTFTPNGVTPTSSETFTYTITDDIASTDTATVTLTYIEAGGRYINSITNTGTPDITVSGRYNTGLPFLYIISGGQTVNVNSCIIEASIITTDATKTSYSWNDTITC